MNAVFDIARLQSRMGTVAGFAVMLLGVLAVISPHISGITCNDRHRGTDDGRRHNNDRFCL